MVANQASAGAADAGQGQTVINIDPVVLQRPRLAPEVELVGAMQDTAFAEEQWLICYGEDQYIQATKLLYHVLLFSDGASTADQIAERIGEATGIEITGEQVAWLIENRLAASGLLDLTPPARAGRDEADDELEPPVVLRPAEMPVLGIRYRIPLLPYRWTSPVAGLLSHLYWPPLMVAVVLAAVAINVWTFSSGGLLEGMRTVLFSPQLVLVLFGLEILLVLFHELGHAAALKRAKQRYGPIGFAIYVIWPVLYTDVTHVYRLNRAQRIRVDLGGMYFQLIAMIPLMIAYLWTDNGIFLLAIVMTTFSFLQQFTPFLRFDGYYVIADTLGIHEPLSLVKPFLRDLIPLPRGRKRELPPMKLAPKLAFVGYMLAIVAFLSYPLMIGAFAGRELIMTVASSGQLFFHRFVDAWAAGDIVSGLAATLQLLMWLLVPIGLSLFALTLTRHFGRGGIALLRAVARRVRPRRADALAPQAAADVVTASPNGARAAPALHPVHRAHPGVDPAPAPAGPRGWRRLGMPAAVVALAAAIMVGGTYLAREDPRAAAIADPADAPLAAAAGPEAAAPAAEPDLGATLIGPVLPAVEDPATGTDPSPAGATDPPAEAESPTSADGEAAASEEAASSSSAETATGSKGQAELAEPLSAADELLARVAQAEAELTSGRLDAVVDYPDGSRSTMTMLFDLGAAERPARLHVTTMYAGSDGRTTTTERVTIGERAWERQGDGQWTEVLEQEGVWGRVRSFLPDVAGASDVTLESVEGAAVLVWDDHARGAGVRLEVNSEAGVPVELCRESHTSGAVLTVTYHDWNGEVAIIEPPTP